MHNAIFNHYTVLLRLSFTDVESVATNGNCMDTSCKACRFYTNPDCLELSQKEQSEAYNDCLAEHYHSDNAILVLITNAKYNSKLYIDCIYIIKYGM